MLARTFYWGGGGGGGGSGSASMKVDRQTRAAQADAEQAANRLERLLTLHASTTNGPTTKLSEHRDLTSPSAAPSSSAHGKGGGGDEQQNANKNEEIDGCISGLEILKNRLVQQSQLLRQIAQANTDLQNLPRTLKQRVREVDEQTAEVQAKLDNVLEERELLMRQLLIARQQLQEDESSSDSDFGPLDNNTERNNAASSMGNGPPTRGSCVTASTVSDTWDLSPASCTSTPVHVSHLQTAKWDDSLDDFDTEDIQQNIQKSQAPAK